jgi:beta-lactamase class D
MLLRFILAGACCCIAAQETFVLSRGGKITTEGAAQQRFAPCSTFKIPNSLIALETSVAPDPEFRLQYDPKRDGEQHGAWSRDQDLRSAVRYSAAWYFREIARRVGPERMKDWLERFDYGNQAITPGVDRFWLGQDLAVSALEQVRFLERLQQRQLGVSDRTTDLAREMIRLETAPDYVWYGKTGSCRHAGGEWILWHVGFVQRGAESATYALNLSGPTYSEAAARRARLVREKLSRAGLIAVEAPDARTQMQARIDAALRTFAGKVSLFAKNLDTGEQYGINPDARVRTASTIKLPIMAAVFAAVQQGKVRWHDRIGVRPQDKVGGSGVIHELADGTKLTLRDLVHLMIVVSDNTATNLVVDHVAADFVNAQMDKLGLKQTRALRKVLGSGPAAGHSREGLQEEYKAFGLGVSTPREMVTLIEKLSRGQIVTAEASADMLAILQRQQLKDGIGRKRASEVASKSGSLDALRSDVGLVRSSGGRIAIAVTVDGMPRTDYSPDNAGNLLISELSELLVEGLAAPLAEISNMDGPEKVVELKAQIDHVQGIHVDAERLWVSWVDRKGRTGHLGEFELSTGKLVRSTEVQKGARYHPGGIAGDGASIWVPVAEYSPRSSALIQKRNRETLEVEAEFEVPDHIGCVAVFGDRVFGGNWDSREIYTWDRAGNVLAIRPNTAGTSYQDLKAVGDTLIAAGLRGGEGAVDWLAADDLSLRKRVRVGRTNRGVILTHEGMAIAGGRIYFVPEDGPSRLLVYRSPW